MLSCLCFSKDRPLQLEAYIESFFWSLGEQTKLAVLYTCESEQFTAAYQILQERYPQVEWIKEDDFRQQVKEWISSCDDLLIFGCDDVIFRQQANYPTIKKHMLENPDTLGFSLRLGKDITYAVQYARSTPRPKFSNSNEEILTWNWPQALGDWTYPFELCATVYHRNFVEQVIQGLDDLSPERIDFTTKNWGQPNRFESLAQIVVHSLNNLPPNMSCLEQSCASTITVNRVQDECKNKVFDDNSEMSTEQLLQMWNSGITFDLEAYRDGTFRCIHTGACYLKDKDGKGFIEGNYDFMSCMIKDFVTLLHQKRPEAVQSEDMADFTQKFAQYYHTTDKNWDLPHILQPQFITAPETFSTLSDSPLWSQKMKDICHDGSQWLDWGSHPKASDLLKGICPQIQNGRNRLKEFHSVLSLFQLESSGLSSPVNSKAYDEQMNYLNFRLASGSQLLLGFYGAPNPHLNFERFLVNSKENVLKFFPTCEVIDSFDFSDNGFTYEETPDLSKVYSFLLLRKP
ncbi:MAG: hypothetical protein HRT88_08045 [Lentisphaeraceae bacterium]|nr:hypothetical protein [Lentisphaeraceae bacterium]